MANSSRAGEITSLTHGHFKHMELVLIYDTDNVISKTKTVFFTSEWFSKCPALYGHNLFAGLSKSYKEYKKGVFVFMTPCVMNNVLYLCVKRREKCSPMEWEAFGIDLETNEFTCDSKNFFRGQTAQTAFSGSSAIAIEDIMENYLPKLFAQLGTLYHGPLEDARTAIRIDFGNEFSKHNGNLSQIRKRKPVDKYDSVEEENRSKQPKKQVQLNVLFIGMAQTTAALNDGNHQYFRDRLQIDSYRAAYPNETVFTLDSNHNSEAEANHIRGKLSTFKRLAAIQELQQMSIADRRFVAVTFVQCRFPPEYFQKVFPESVFKECLIGFIKLSLLENNGVIYMPG